MVKCARSYGLRMEGRDIPPRTDIQALERRLETLELTLAEMVAIHRRVELVLVRNLEEWWRHQ
jgi:hypothetical protein